MWYSFYMNERMLLDEWKYYQKKGECNWLLKRTLMNDNTRTAADKKAFYYNNRRVINDYPDWFKEQAEKVQEYCWDMHGRFDNQAQEDYYLDHLFLNDGYEIMDYGRKQRAFNMYRRYNELKEHANEKVNIHLSFEPIKGAKFREHKFVLMNDKDIKFIREARKYYDLTVPQIEILFGIIFFCRMHDSEKAQLDTRFKKLQFLGCFDNATAKDFEYVVDNIYGLELTEDKDVIYHRFSWTELDDKWIPWNVTRFNNKLNLSKVCKYFITDLKDKRYCAVCLRPFKPTNNRQKVCEHCKPQADAVKAKLRKTKQRYIEKNGKDACCGTCTDCTKTDCNNWWEYWFDELDNRWMDYMIENKWSYPRNSENIPQEEKDKILDKLLYDIENVYTKEEKSEIIPYEMKYKFKRYNPYA